MQDILIDIGENDEEEASSNATYETALSGADTTVSEAVSQSEAVSPNEALLASDSGRRSEAQSQGASASADLEAGADAADYADCNNDGESDMPLVRSPSWHVHKCRAHAVPQDVESGLTCDSCAAPNKA